MDPQENLQAHRKLTLSYASIEMFILSFLLVIALGVNVLLYQKLTKAQMQPGFHPTYDISGNDLLVYTFCSPPPYPSRCTLHAHNIDDPNNDMAIADFNYHIVNLLGSADKKVFFFEGPSDNDKVGYVDLATGQKKIIEQVTRASLNPPKDKKKIYEDDYIRTAVFDPVAKKLYYEVRYLKGPGISQRTNILTDDVSQITEENAIKAYDMSTQKTTQLMDPQVIGKEKSGRWIVREARGSKVFLMKEWHAGILATYDTSTKELKNIFADNRTIVATSIDQDGKQVAFVEKSGEGNSVTLDLQILHLDTQKEETISTISNDTMDTFTNKVNNGLHQSIGIVGFNSKGDALIFSVTTKVATGKDFTRNDTSYFVWKFYNYGSKKVYPITTPPYNFAFGIKDIWSDKSPNHYGENFMYGDSTGYFIGSMSSTADEMTSVSGQPLIVGADDVLLIPNNDFIPYNQR